MSSTFKPTLLLMSGRALAFFATFFIPVLLVRVFDPATFGTYKQLLLVFATLYPAVPLGIGESLYYFLPGEQRRGGRHAANTVLALALVSVAVFAALVGFAPELARGLGNAEVAHHIGMLGVFFGLMLTSTPLEIVLVCRNKHRTAAWTYGVSDLVRAALMIGPALVFGTLSGVLAGAVAFGVVRLVGTLVVLVREFDGGLVPDLGALREQLAYSLPFGLAAVVDTVQANYHQFAVAHRFDAVAFAVYSVGCLQVPLVDWLAGPAGNVMMVRMAEHRGDTAAIVGLWHETTRRLALVFVPLAALLMLVAPDFLVFLFTPTYAGSAPIMRICCVTLALALLQTDAALRSLAETPFLLASNLLRLGVVAASIPWFIDRFHIAGAALAAVGAGLVAKAVALHRIERRLGTGLARVLPWRSLAATSAVAAAAVVPAALVRSELSPATFPLLAVTSLVYGVVYAALAGALVLTPEERRSVVDWAGRRIGRQSVSALVVGG